MLEYDPLSSDFAMRADYLRTDRGTFAPGTAPGPGRPKSTAPMARLRQRMLTEITEEDVQGCVKALREIIGDSAAKPGDRLSAVKELLDRAVGKPSPGDLSELVEEVERLLGKTGEDE